MKITGDDTVVSCSRIIDGESATSPSENHAIALINTNEDYDNLLKALENIVSEIKTLQKKCHSVYSPTDMSHTRISYKIWYYSTIHAARSGEIE